MKKLNLIIIAVNLSAKMIVTALFKNLSNALFLTKAKAMSAAFITNTALFPDLNPVPADFKIEVDKYDALETKEKNLLEQVKANTEAKKQQRKVINDIVVDKYCKQVQNTPGVTVENVKLVGLGIKGVDDQQAPDGSSVKNSFPVLDDYDINTHLEQTFTVHNSMTGKSTLPPDAKRVDIYELICKDLPDITDTTKMIYIGSPSRGKMTNHFTADQVGLEVLYISVYVPKDKGSANLLCGKCKKTIV